MHPRWSGIEGETQHPFSLLKVKAGGVEEQGLMSITRVKGTVSHHMVENFRTGGQTRNREHTHREELPLAGEQEEVLHVRTTWRAIATAGHKATRWRQWNGGEKITGHQEAEEAAEEAGAEEAVHRHSEEIQHHRRQGGHRRQGEVTDLEQRKGSNSEQDYQSTIRRMNTRMCSQRGRIGTRMETCYAALRRCAANLSTTQSSAKDAVGKDTPENGAISPKSRVSIQQDTGL
jgi:hypothetical protein